MHDVAPLDRSNAGAAAGTFAKAFFDDPLFGYIQPDEHKREQAVESQIRLMMNIGLRCGVSDATPDAKGVAVWMPPGQEPTPMDMLRAGALSVPFRSGFSPFTSRRGPPRAVFHICEGRGVRCRTPRRRPPARGFWRLRPVYAPHRTGISGRGWTDRTASLALLGLR